MNSTKKLLTKLDDFFIKEYQEISKVSIIKNKDGSYDFFDKYLICKTNNGYQVTKKTTYVKVSFSFLKNAVSWCIFDFRNKLAECTKIENLDRSLASIETSIVWHNKLIKATKDKENIILYYAKMSDELAKKTNYQKELSILINDCKIWQTKRFEQKTKN